MPVRAPQTPAHVGIIMDGNGRWAQARGLPRFEGHRRGVEAVRRAVRAAIELGVRYLTIYSFSTENWRRPPDEVAMLMGLLKRFIRNDLAELHANDVRVRVIGERDGPARPTFACCSTRRRRSTREQSRPDPGRRLQLRRPAGDRRRRAASGRATSAAGGSIRMRSARRTSRRGSTRPDIPDPDLIIRTSGEQRLSNFLLWQAAYAELVFLPILWPDFDEAAFVAALDQYAARERRFGAAVEPRRSHDRVVTATRMSAQPDDANARPEPGRGVPRIGPDLWPRVAAAVVMGVAALAVAWVGGIRVPRLLVDRFGRRAVGMGADRRRASGCRCASPPARSFSPSPRCWPCTIARSWPSLALVAAAVAVGCAGGPESRVWAGAGVLYAGALVVGLGLLRGEPDLRLAAILWLFAVVWGTDVVAYFAGRAIGGPKLWPSVSPGKTWSGAIAGALAGAALGLAVSLVLVPGRSRSARSSRSGLAARWCRNWATCSKSAIKRRSGVKDSSRLIPGHGGLMDRLDGFIAATAFAALVAAANSRGSFIASGLFQW